MRQRCELGAAVVSLRKALGMTQQRFAVEALKTAISTVARYETSHPPRGKVLIRLSQIAKRNNFVDISREFLKYYLDEVFDGLRDEGIDERDLNWAVKGDGRILR